MENNRIELHENAYRYKSMSSRIGFIADKVGSGKSYVILSLIRENPLHDRPPQENIYTVCSGMIRLYNNEQYDMINTSILVVPHTIKKQWVKYIETFDKHMKYIVIDTNKSLEAYLGKIQARCVNVNDDHDHDHEHDQTDTPVSSMEPTNDEIVEQGTTNIRIGTDRDRDPDRDPELILITGSMFGLFTRALACHRRMKFSRLVIDEADTCKVTNMHYIPCNFFWLVTASWQNITNPHTHYRYDSVTGSNVVVHNGISNNAQMRTLVSKLFRDVSISVVKHIFVKNKDEYVDRCLELPDLVIKTWVCKTPMSIRVLSGNINQNILNHLHAGDIQGALSVLNADRVDTEENIIRAILTEYRTQLENIEIQIFAQERMTMPERTREERLKKLRTDRDLLKDNISNITDRIKENGTMCVICYEEPKNRTKCITCCCNNTMCMECITKWLSSSRDTKCPLCRKEMTMNDVYVVDNQHALKEDNHASTSTQKTEPEYLTKNMQLISIIQGDTPIKKVLVFSSYMNTLRSLKNELAAAGIKCEMIKGSSSHIHNVIHDFKNANETRVLLMDSEYCGAGINLENSTDVVLLHKFQLEVESQIIGRAQRPGRSSPLNVHYLIHHGE